MSGVMTVELPAGLVTTVAPAPATPQAATTANAVKDSTLRGLFRRYRWRILLTYGLFNLESLLELAQPLVLGWAINDLLQSSSVGLLWFVAQHLCHLVIGSLRRAYDTRVYSSIYADMATRLVVTQRGRDVQTSRVSARSALSRSLVDFFEMDVPVVVNTLYLVVGALVMLAFYDWLLLPICLVLLAPACVLNSFYSRRTFGLSGRLHDELEREVDVIDQGGPDTVRGHYQRVGRWRIKLSDSQAINFGLMELFVLGLIAAALVRSCSPSELAGDVFAVFRYVMMFIIGLDNVPLLVQKVSLLRDIGRRMLDVEA
jgi:hypothetical protein